MRPSRREHMQSTWDQIRQPLLFPRTFIPCLYPQGPGGGCYGIWRQVANFKIQHDSNIGKNHLLLGAHSMLAYGEALYLFNSKKICTNIYEENIIFIPTSRRKKLRLIWVKSSACIHTGAMYFHGVCFEPLQTLRSPPETAPAERPWEV